MRYMITAVALFASLALACAEDKPAANSNTNTRAGNSIPAGPAATSPVPAGTIDQIAAGRKIYEANCAGCHKDDGSGGAMEIEGKRINPDDLTSDKIKKFSDEKMLGYIVNGIPDEGMPAFKGKLSEGEMRDVVRYIRAEIQKMPAANKAPQS